MRHVLEQGAMLRTLGGAALTVFHGRRTTTAKPETPGPWLSFETAPPSEALIRDFVRSSGGDPSSYRGHIPPTLFPQWAIPAAFQAIAGASYPLLRVINAGCRFEQHAPLPSGERLLVKARLDSVDDDGRRVILTTRIVTGTASAPDALVSELRAYVPLGERAEGDGKAKGGKKPTTIVPTSAREVAALRLPHHAGLDFAKLTGDFNPIHWIPAYAKASGFRSSILHGFGTLALASEAVVRRVLSGNASALAWMDARFTRPLVLPARVFVYVSEPRTGERDVYVGEAPGARAYLVGNFATRDPSFITQASEQEAEGAKVG
ncbi:MAG TPA: MaoC/PaaZ C-terminal domain-containing protein [Labilithrix sp.]|nr:MaoC/PaaZ C-terminal domain-containing protein [Labilithrix sp.]